MAVESEEESEESAEDLVVRPAEEETPGELVVIPAWRGQAAAV